MLLNRASEPYDPACVCVRERESQSNNAQLQSDTPRPTLLLDAVHDSGLSMHAGPIIRHAVCVHASVRVCVCVYLPRVSAAITTPPSNLMPTTEVPVTIGCLWWGGEDKVERASN